MPTLSNPALWRTHPYSSKGYLYVHKPAVVFRSRVAQTYFDYPLLQITYDRGEGNYTDALEGYTVLFGTSEGADDLGRQRLRLNATDATIFIGWSSIGQRDGEVWLAYNAYITVLYDRRVWARVPRILNDGTELKDGTIYPGTYPQYPPPIAHGGVGMAGFVDESTNVLTVTFTSSESRAMVDGASIASQLWDIGDGTLVAGYALSDETIQATFPGGFRYVKLTVTDTIGTSAWTTIPVFAAEKTGANAPITKFKIKRSLRPEGQTANIDLLTDLDADTYPDGTLVMYWQEERYGTTVGSLAGPTGREHMKFIGWHETDSSQLSASPQYINKTHTLRCVDVAGRLASLPGFPRIIERKAAATIWRELTGADIDKYVHHLLWAHSTALQVTPLNLASSDGVNYPFAALSSDGAVLYEQADGRAKAIAHRLTCDSRGILYLRPDPQQLDTANRTATSIVSLTDQDYTTWSKTRNRPPRVHWLETTAIIINTDDASAATIEPAFSIAPGKAPGQGGNASAQNYQLVKSAIELYARTGHQYARLNSVHEAIDLELKHGGDAGIEPAYMEWVTLTQTAYDRRLRRFVNTRFLVQGTEISHDNEIGLNKVAVTLEEETIGLPGIDNTPEGYNFPTMEWAYDVYPTTDWGSEDEVVEIIEEDLGIDGLVGIGYSWVNPCGFTDTFTSQYPQWVNGATSISGAVMGIHGVYVGSAFRLYLVTVDGTTGRVYRNPDALSNADDWTLDHTFTITGTVLKMRIMQSKTADLVLVGWKTQAGTYFVRRYNTSWSAAASIGVVTLADTAHDTTELGMVVDGTNQAIAAQTAASGTPVYKPYYAVADSAFAPIANLPIAGFSRHNECLVSDETAYLYASGMEIELSEYIDMYGDPDITRANTNHVIGECAVGCTDTVTAISVTLAGSVEGEIKGHFHLDMTWEDTLQRACINTGFTCYLEVDVQSNSPTPPANLASIVWTLSLTDDEDNVYQDGDTTAITSWATTHPSNYVHKGGFSITSGVSLPAAFNLKQVHITGILDQTEYLVHVTECEFTLFGLVMWTAEILTPRLYRVANWAAVSPTWLDVTPTDDALPLHPEALAFDKTNVDNTWMIGTLPSGDTYLRYSANHGVTWIDYGQIYGYLWLKAASYLHIAGGYSKLDWSIDNLVTVEDRLGNFAAQIGSPNPVQGLTLVMG